MTDLTAEPSVVTDADIAALSQRALVRRLELTRRLSTAVLVVAALVFLAWLWLTLRQQGVIEAESGDFGPVFGLEDPSLQERLDLFTQTIASLGFAAGVAGIGIGLRAYSQVATFNAGGNLVELSVGDPVDDAEPIDLERH